jgi:hypothetical protein
MRQRAGAGARAASDCSRSHAADPASHRLSPLAGRRARPARPMRPFPAAVMRMWPISTRVNKPENVDASLLDQIGLPDAEA